MRRFAMVLPLAMGAICGAYTIIYLVRWEWNRAIIAGLFFVAVEIIFVAMLVVERFRRMEARLETLTHPARVAAGPASASLSDVHPEVLGAIHEAAPAPHDHFAWIRDQNTSTNVFLPVLLGAGVLASGLAWVVENVARSALWPVRERHLVERLAALQPPSGGLLGTPTMPVAVRRSMRRYVRNVGVAVVMVLVLGGTAATIDYVADHTQTRPDVRAADVDTVIELELRGTIAARNPERVIGHLWSVCTGPDVFRLRTLPTPDITHQGGGQFHIRVAADVGDHSLARLRGCLNDATIDKVQARVVRATTTRAI